MKKLYKRIVMVVLVVVLILNLIACGKVDNSVKEKSSFTLGTSVAFDTLSPLTSYMQVTYEFFLLLYEPLVKYDEDYNTIPSLAESWEISDDELTWTFKLKDNVKWHDGVKFTSEDVKYTYELMMDNGLGYMYNSYLTGIEEISCPDELTVVLVTGSPKANMLMNSTPILPKHILSEIPVEELEVWKNENPIGTGPYKFDSTGSNFVKIIKNEEYHGTKPNVDEFIYVNYENTDSMAQALILGEIDGATNLNTTQFDQLEKDKNISVISGKQKGFMQIGLNLWEDPASNGNPLIKDKNIRKAIELGVNKNKIVDMIYNGHGAIGTTIIDPDDYYHYEPTKDELRSFDQDKARKLLSEAGYKDTDSDGILESEEGSKLEFSMITIADNIDEVKTGQLIASDLANIGIKINNITMDSGALYDKIVAGDYDLFIWGWGADLDPTVITAVLTTDQIGNNNEPFFSNARYDELFLLQQNELDEKVRRDQVWEMQRIVYEEVPYIIIVYSNSIQAIRSDRWKDYKQIPDTGSYFFNLTDYNYISLKPAK